MERGIEEPAWLCVVLSPSAVESKWVKEELKYALIRQLAEKRIYVLSILYKHCDIPGFLREKVYADFSADYHAGLTKLQQTLARLYTYHLHELTHPEDLSSRLGLDGTPYVAHRMSRSLNTERTFRKLFESGEALRLLEGPLHGPTGRLSLGTTGGRVHG